jgi:hypothetical protein
LGAVAGTEFDHGSADVGAGGDWAEDQAGGDLVVVEALSDQGEDFPFAVGESGEAVLGGVAGRAGGGELGDEPSGDAGDEQRVAGAAVLLAVNVALGMYKPRLRQPTVHTAGTVATVSAHR